MQHLVLWKIESLSSIGSLALIGRILRQSRVDLRPELVTHVAILQPQIILKVH